MGAILIPRSNAFLYNIRLLGIRRYACTSAWTMLFSSTRSKLLFAALGLFVLHHLYSYSRPKSSSDTLSSLKANPPPPQIVAFWEKWAGVFNAARPAVKNIEVLYAAPSRMSNDTESERKPTTNSLGVSKEDIDSLRQSHRRLVGHPGFNKTNEEASKLFHGSGVVTIAGGEYTQLAILGIRMLRRTGSTLPVQVFIQDNSEYEPEVCEEILPALNAECYVIADSLRKDKPFNVTHYQLKVMAIVFSSFETVLWLDSDCISLRDPAELINNEPFLSTGLISWPDYWASTEDPVFYEIAGVPYPTGVPLLSSESGQLLVSKNTHLSSLLLAAYYNIFGPDYYYPIFSQGCPGQGDKETFLAAAIVLGLPYYRVKQYVGALGYTDMTGGFHGKAMEQYHAGDDYLSRNTTDHAKSRPFFLHANTRKMNVARFLDDGDVFMPGTDRQVRLRIWGSPESTIGTIGYDVEKVVWGEMLYIGCAMEHILEDFRGRKKLCERAREHYEAVFDDNATFAAPGDG